MRHLNRQGQSLIQVMISAAVTGILMVAFLSMQSTQQRSTAAIQTFVARNMLQLQLQQALINSSAINYTLSDATDSGNVALKSCLQPIGASCAQTTSPRGFSLYDGTNAKISGSGSSAVLRYDQFGAPCLTASSQCLFEVYTEFSAVCPGGVSPCATPGVTATYTIQLAPGITPVGGTLLKKLVSQPVSLPVNGLGKIAGTCETYTTHSGTILGNAHCWGLAQDAGTTVNCLGGSIYTILGNSEDMISPGETASNGVDLYAGCMEPGPPVTHWCNAGIVGCML
jgi:hypothetical protein